MEGLNFINNISCHRINMALRTICLERDWARKAVREGVKIDQTKERQDKNDMSISFADGVLEMHCAYALRTRWHVRRHGDLPFADGETVERKTAAERTW